MKMCRVGTKIVSIGDLCSVIYARWARCIAPLQEALRTLALVPSYFREDFLAHGGCENEKVGQGSHCGYVGYTYKEETKETVAHSHIKY